MTVKSMSRVQREQQTIEQMITLYCRKKEGNKELCSQCKELIEYAHTRLSRCPFGEKKSTCRLCTIHCYKPEMKEQMRKVMRFTGAKNAAIPSYSSTPAFMARTFSIEIV